MVSNPIAPALPQTSPRSRPRDAGSRTSIALQCYRKAHRLFLNKGFFRTHGHCNTGHSTREDDFGSPFAYHLKIQELVLSAKGGAQRG